jgi:hypothetical protein
MDFERDAYQVRILSQHPVKVVVMAFEDDGQQEVTLLAENAMVGEVVKFLTVVDVVHPMVVRNICLTDLTSAMSWSMLEAELCAAIVDALCVDHVQQQQPTNGDYSVDFVGSDGVDWCD